MPWAFHQFAIRAPVGIYATDSRGHCTYVNRRLCELFGIARRRALGTGWMGKVHPADRDHVKRARLAALSSGKDFQVQYRILRGRRKVTWIQATSSPLIDGRGRFVGRFGVAIDVTAQKTAEVLLHGVQEELRSLTQRSPLVLRALSGPPGAQRPAVLSAQEWRVLALVSRGHTNKEVATELKLSDKTVKNYLSNIFSKLSIHRRTEAVLYFTRLEAKERPI